MHRVNIIEIVLIAMELLATKLLCTGVPRSSVLKLMDRMDDRQSEGRGRKITGSRLSDKTPDTAVSPRMLDQSPTHHYRTVHV